MYLDDFSVPVLVALVAALDREFVSDYRSHGFPPSDAYLNSSPVPHRLSLRWR